MTTATVDVRVRRLPHGADLPLPEYQTPDSAGTLIPTGLSIALPPGFEAQVRPRSGLALRNGVTQVNTPGTIDADYRGEIGVILINHGQEPFTVTRGMRIAQMLVAPVIQARWQEVEELDETARGSGGFGSTGTG